MNILEPLKHIVFYTKIVAAPVLPDLEYERLHNDIALEQPAPIIQEEFIEVEATFYGPDCVGCSGITSVGYDVRNTIYHKGLRVIAVDPKLIKLGTIVEVDIENYGKFKAIAGDIGGDIKGHRIDVLVGSEKESFNYGRQKAKIKILEETNE